MLLVQGCGVVAKVVSVSLTGDPCVPAASRLRQWRETLPAVALTSVYGPHAGETVILPADRPVVLGQSADADLSLPKEKAYQPQHLEIQLDAASLNDARRRPAIHLRDLSQRNDVMINNVAMKATGIATVGDVLQLGAKNNSVPTALLFHFDLGLEAW